jgi:hypothetical protein
MILSKYSEIISEINLKPIPIQVDIRKTFLTRPKPIQFKQTQEKLSY